MTGELSSCSDKREQPARIVHVAFNLCVCLRVPGKKEDGREQTGLIFLDEMDMSWGLAYLKIMRIL